MKIWKAASWGLLLFSSACLPNALGDDWDWRHSTLGSSPRLSSNASPSDLAARGVLDVHDDACLSDTQKPMNSKNGVFDGKGRHMLRGTTYWVNEFMAVGHMMFDAAIIQVLFSRQDPGHDIHRIILQRAPCATHDLCQGKGTWEGFYKPFYALLMEATGRSSVPIFVRFNADDYWKPFYFAPSANSSDSAIDGSVHRPEEGPIHVEGQTCFQHLIRRHCTNCFHNGISPAAARALKKTAYKKASLDSTTPLPYQLETKAVVITVAYRGTHRRRMADPQPLVRALTAASLPNVIVNLFNTDDPALDFNTVIRVLHASQVVVGTHGAFESHLVFMREGSLFVEIRGSPPDADFKDAGNDYFELAKSCLVHHRHVTALDLKTSDQDHYSLRDAEMDSIVAIVRDYLQHASFPLTDKDMALVDV